MATTLAGDPVSHYHGYSPGGAMKLHVATLGALVALGLGLRLPENNQSKFWNLLFLLLAAPAALFSLAAFDRAGRAARRWLVAGFAAGVVPTAAACLLAFGCERGQNEEPAHFASRDSRAAWEWARTHTAPDAVFADAEGASDMLVLAGRSALWGGGATERDWGHPAEALEVRRRASRELCSAAELSPEVRELLASLGRHVIVVERAVEGDSGPVAAAALVRAGALAPAGDAGRVLHGGGARAADSSSVPSGALARGRYTPLFHNAELALYRWEAAP